MTQNHDNANARRQIEQLNVRFYNNRSPDRAFAHWALKCLLSDVEPDDTFLRDFHTAIGGPKDLGIDAYWIDVENNRLLLLQAKDTTAVQRKDAMEFRGAIEALRDSDYVMTHGNNYLKELYPSIYDALYDESYTLHAVLAAGGQVRPAASDYCKGEGSASLLITDASSDIDFTHLKEVTLEALSIPDLMERARQLASLESPRVALPVALTDTEPAFHHMSGEFRAVVATVPALSLAQAFDRYRSAIFKYNPRGPQGSNKTNKDIKQTLSDPQMRKYFHLFNNGITVVCESLQYFSNDQTMVVQDFQVVNGCQTVYTLYDSTNDLSPDVQVNVRIIEGGQQWIAKEIARTSNSQTAVKTPQLASMGREHDAIAQTLEYGDYPWYYEKQLGQTRFNTPSQRRAHQDRFGDRTVNIIELGQYGAAFIGHPALAKYDLQAVYEKRGQHGMFVYERIFNPNNTREQLLLPVLVGRRVFSEVKSKLAEYMAEPNPDPTAFTILNWLNHARHHMIGLVGTVARGSASVSLQGLPAADLAHYRVETIEEWFPDAFNKAYSAADWVVSVARAADRLTNIRNFFREQSTYVEMENRMSVR